MNHTSTLKHARQLKMSLVLTGVLTLGACASMPPPTARLDAAHRAIADAQQAEAGRFAPRQLGEARAKLASARAAVSAQRMTAAGQLAEESRAEADLALSMTTEAKARVVNDEMMRSTKILIDEMQRSSGDIQ